MNQLNAERFRRTAGIAANWFKFRKLSAGGDFDLRPHCLAMSVALLNRPLVADKVSCWKGITGQEAGIRTRTVRFTGGDAAVTPQS